MFFHFAVGAILWLCSFSLILLPPCDYVLLFCCWCPPLIIFCYLAVGAHLWLCSVILLLVPTPDNVQLFCCCCPHLIMLPGTVLPASRLEFCFTVLQYSHSSVNVRVVVPSYTPPCFQSSIFDIIAFWEHSSLKYSTYIKSNFKYLYFFFYLRHLKQPESMLSYWIKK